MNSFLLSVSSKIRQFSFDAIVVTLSRVISALGSLATVYLLTKYLSPADYGLLNLMMTFSIIATQILIGPLGAGATRFYMASVEYNDTKRYFESIYHSIKLINSLILLSGLLCAVYILIFQSNSENYEWVWLVLVITLFSMITSYISIFNGVFLAAQKQLVTSIYQGVEPWLKVGIAMVAIIFFGYSTLSVLLGYTFAIAIILVSQYLLISRFVRVEGKEGNKQDWLSRIKSYSMPFVLWGSFTSLHIVSDRWALQFFSSLENVGFYSVLYQIGYFPITLIIGILVQLATPYIYKRAGLESCSNRKSEIKKVGLQLIFTSAIITIILAIFLFFTKEFIFKSLFSNEYSYTAYLLPYMCMAAGLFATGQVATLILQSEIDTKILLKPKIVSSILGILLNITGAYFYGVEGIVAALIVYGLIYLVWIVNITFYRYKGINEVSNEN